MNRLLLGAGLALAVLIAAATEARPNSTTSTEPAQPRGISIDLGANDFRTYCAACHGVSGKGDGTVAEFLTIAAPDLTLLSKRNGGLFPSERIIEMIDGRTEVKVHGPRDMPVWGDWFNYEAMTPDTDRDTRAIIVRERIDSLVAYLESIQLK